MWPFFSGSQIDGAARCIEQPLIGVQFVHRGYNSLVGARKALGSGRGLGGWDQVGELGLIALGGRNPAHPSHSVICDQPVVETPALAIPSEPLSQAGNIA